MDKALIMPGMKFTLLNKEYLILSIENDVVTLSQGDKTFTYGLDALAHMALNWRNNNAMCDEGLL